MCAVRKPSALLLVTACVLSTQSVDAQIVFPGEDINLGVNVTQLTSADLDGDSFPDFASVRIGSNAVRIVISNGAGGFEQTRFQTFSGIVSSVALADLNSDGRVDLLAGRGGGMEVLLGNGNGTFSASQAFPNSVVTSSDLIADLNGDTFLDVIGTPGGAIRTVSLGDGFGGFSGIVSSPGGGDGRTRLGDVNGDGKLDSITAVPAGGQAGLVTVQFGDGAGHFASYTIPGAWTEGQLNDVTVGDWNGDGKSDCAVAVGSNSTSVHQYVTTFLSNGSGIFTSRVDIPIPSNPIRIASGDINGDGKLDIAVVTYGGALTVLLGNGNGGFSWASNSTVGANALELLLNDLDQDGDLDISVMSRPATPADSRISTLLGTGTGAMVAPSSSYTPLSLPVGANTVSVALGDLNGDAIQDLCTADVQTGRIAVALAQGGGGFWPATMLPAIGLPRRVALSDMDSNGTLDIVSANKSSNVISVRFGDGFGAFAAAIDTGTLADPQDLAIGDLNADGHPDVVAIDRSGASTAWIALGLGDGAFWPPTARYAGQLSTALALADVDLDGKLDLIVCNEGADDVSVALGNGAGGFGPAIFYVVADGPRDLAVGDVNGDGRPDIAVACYNASVVSLLMGGTPPGFGSHTIVNTANSPLSIALGDVDFDGRLDILTGHPVNRVCWLRGIGQGGFEPHRQYRSNNSGEDVQLGDVSGDGKSDVVSVGTTHASILVNQTQVPTPTSFCFGDGTSSACPCGTGAAGNGCPNSALASGARLAATGVASVSNDSLKLTASSLPSGPGLYFQGTAPLDTALNDGKVCAGGTLVRLGVAFATSDSSQFPSTASTVTIGSTGAVPLAGGLRYYQLAYRDTAPGFCSRFTHNMTNGIAVTWIP